MKREPLGNGFYVNVTPHHTFGTDAILLANFAGARRDDRLVDLGTGCGIVPLLLLRDGRLARAVGVDISPEAAALCRRTAEELQLTAFHIIESNLKELKGKLDFGCHTLVTCNPPYKSPDGGLKNSDPVTAAARHEIACTLEDIVAVSSRLLQTAGRFCVCHRPERLNELLRLITSYRLEPKRLQLVCQRRGEEPWLVLVEGKKCARQGLRIAPPLYVEQDGELSAEMREIYGSYKEER